LIEPVKESDDILLDSMMIGHMLMAKWQYELKDQHYHWKHNLENSKYIVQKIKDRLSKCKSKSKLILLNIIEEETIDMKKRKYGITYSEKDIENVLSEIGDFEKVFVEDSPILIREVLSLYDAQSYDCPNGGILSPQDCYLLKIHVTQPQYLLTRPASLLTEDECLQKAALTEGRETKGIDDVGVTYIQKKEWDKLERIRIIQEKSRKQTGEVQLKSRKQTEEVQLKSRKQTEEVQLKSEKLEKSEKIESERIERERFEKEKKKLTTTYHLCSECRISYTEENECPNCGK